MTEAGIKYNLDKLTFFIRHKEPVAVKENTVNDFLDCYTRILDYHGSPKEGWGLIFLELDDFNEVVEYVRVRDKETGGGVKDLHWLSPIPVEERVKMPENERKHGLTALIHGYWLHFIHIDKIYKIWDKYLYIGKMSMLLFGRNPRWE